MTPQEQAQADNKMRAQIATLFTEESKIDKQADWYLLAIGAGSTLAIVAIVELFM